MVTLSGGAERHEMRTQDGLRYDGPDRVGSLSYLPAGCERRLRLTGVEWRWASITLPEADMEPFSLAAVPSFCDARDPVLHGLLAELLRLLVREGSLEAAYCESVAGLIGRYLSRKYLRSDAAALPVASPRLTARQLGRIEDFVRSRLADPIPVGALATLIDRSVGHLHRAFRATTGDTPLAYLNRLRIDRAGELMRTTDLSVAQVALEVGFASPTAFARTFRKARGENPGIYRARLRAG